MGCGASAYKNDLLEFEEALEKVKLKGDKKWGSVDVYSSEACVIINCARENKTTDQTIRELHLDIAIRKAHTDAEAEIRERGILRDLRDKYLF